MTGPAVDTIVSRVITNQSCEEEEGTIVMNFTDRFHVPVTAIDPIESLMSVMSNITEAIKAERLFGVMPFEVLSITLIVMIFHTFHMMLHPHLVAFVHAVVLLDMMLSVSFMVLDVPLLRDVLMFMFMMMMLMLVGV